MIFNASHQYLFRITAIGLLGFVTLYLAKDYNYLLFHTAAELYSIIIAFTIYTVFINSYEKFNTGLYSVVGAVYLYTGILDFFHTLSYSGMNIFPGYGANLPTSLWIAARYLESFGLLAGVFLIKYRPRNDAVFILLGLLCTLLLVSIFTGAFPACFVAESGLTTFKVASEYIISAVLVVAIFLAWRHREKMDRRECALLIGACAVTIAAEMAFTLYNDVYGFFNMAGHYLKIISYYLICKAMVTSGLHRPYIELSKKEQALKTMLKEKNLLLAEVHHRVKNNLQNIISIIQMQAARAADPAVGPQLGRIAGRIKSIGMVHEMMYQHNDISQIPFNSYIAALASSACQAAAGSAAAVRCHGDDIYLTLDEAVPIGLFADELFCAARRYSTKETVSGVDIALSRTRDDKRIISFTTPHCEPGDTEHSLQDQARGQGAVDKGLLEALPRQAGAELTMAPSSDGKMTYTIALPILKETT